MHKISRNVIVVSKDNDNYIVANTHTNNIIQLSRVALEDLRRGDASCVQGMTTDEYDQCVEMGFLVPIDLDENAFMKHVFLRERMNPDYLVVYLMYSSECNFNCVYCYETNQVQRMTMAPDTVAKTIRWFRYRLENGDYKGCSVVLFGGEPLLFEKQFLSIISQIKTVTDKLNKELKTTLYSNGYLLKPDFLYKLKFLGLEEIHITIDGEASAHNKLRQLKGGGYPITGYSRLSDPR